MTQHAQLEALALALLLLMMRGLVESAVPLEHDDWHDRQVWASLPTLSLATRLTAGRR